VLAVRAEQKETAARVSSKQQDQRSQEPDLQR
jgi:hypothetical protein